jgi:predicted alpha/beta-fold hydrolase
VELVKIALGDGFALHARAWWAAETGRRPLVIVIHGIGGSSESRSVLRAAVALHRAGFHVARLDLRGAGSSAVDAPTLYHAGLSSDLDAVIASFAPHPRVDGVHVLGFSGGGSIALKRAGEWGSRAPADLRSIVTISAPLDYTIVAPRMETLPCLPYRFHVLGGLVESARAFARAHPGRAPYRAEDVKRLGTFREYDATVIVPMHGFESVDGYWFEASSGRFLQAIEVPTLLLHAEDDPMVPMISVRPWLARASRAVTTRTSAHGGHVGWVGGLDEASWVRGWAVRQALEFFERP